MNLRTLVLSISALLVLCAVAWFARRPADSVTADPRVGQPLLAPDLATQAAGLRLTDTGKTITLTRQANGTWIVPSYHDFPADFAKLSKLVGDLTEAKYQRLVTARADRLGRLEFKDTTLALTDAAGKELWQITLGKNAEGGGRFVRYGTEGKGYLANLSAWLDPEPKNWADATLLALKADDIARVEIGFPDPAAAAVIATREKKESPWTAAAAPAGQRLKADRITSLLGNLVALRFTDTTPLDDEKAAAARQHARTVKLTTFDQKTYTLVFARTPEEKKLKPKAPAAATPAPATPDTTTENKPTEPEYETIPAGPVFVSITSSDEKARVNELMKKRAFQIGEWIYTGLPATAADLWEPAPAEAVSPPVPATPAKP